MATIYSVTNFVGTKSFTDTSAWTGGVVPGTADTVYIRGIRTTINMSSFAAWAGTKTITVASTSGFPASGTFYTGTDRGQKVKIDYTGTTGTTFTGCVIDTSYFLFEVNNTPTYNIHGGSIFNGAYVHFTPIIEVNNITVSTGHVIIEYGGYLKVHNNGIYGFQNYTAVRDGTFEATGNATVNFELNNLVSNTGTASQIRGENYYLSRIIFEGTENRLNTTLTEPAIVGDGKITVTDASEFEVNDYILVKHPKLDILRLDDGFRSAYSAPVLDDNGTYVTSSNSLDIMDEAFNVAGVDGNDIYLSRMNSIDVKVLATTGNSNVIITDSTRLQAGDKIVVNNQIRTITNVQDYDYLLRDYDFTQAGTTLDDWTTDTDRSAYFANFAKSATPVSGSAYALIQHGTTSYRHIFIKDMMRQEVKIEAWISNYRNVSSGTSDGGALGICIHADPVMDYDRGYDSFGRTYFEMDGDNNRFRLLQRAMGNDSNSRLTTAGITFNGLHKYTVECRGGVIKGYIDDELLCESFMRSGGYFGRVGLHCSSQNSFTCTRFKVYAAAQQITLDSGVTCSEGDTVYETGAEYFHRIGDVVVKQASNVEDALGHSNLAYCYGGAAEYRGDQVYPYIWNAVASSTTNYTRNTNTSFYNLINNQTVYDLASYNFASNTTTLGSMIIDLDATRTFTHVTFLEYYRSQGQYFSAGGYIGVKVSNDRVTWTDVNIGLGDGTFAATVYDDRRKETGDSVRIYQLQSAQTARYIMIYRYGGNNTSTAENRWSSLGVRNYSDGYKIKLSNVSDFSVDDRVMPLYQGPYNSGINESNYYSGLIAGTVPSSSWTNNLTDYYTVTAVDEQNKTITLDRPYTHSFITRGDRLIKLNRTVKIQGDRGTNIWKRGRFNLYTGSNNGRKYVFKNVEFTNLGSYYPTNIASDYSNSAWGHRSYTVWHADYFDNITYYDCLNQQTSYTSHYYSIGSLINRDSFFLRWNGRGWLVYFPSQYTAQYFVGNVFAYGYQEGNVFYSGISNIYFAYNESFQTNGVGLRVYNHYQSSLSFSGRLAQVKRNYFNGGQNQGFSSQNNIGFGAFNRLLFSDNQFEYQDDYIFQSAVGQFYNTFDNVILPKRGNTDNRLTRFRNEGFMGTDRYVASHIPNLYLKNYNKWGYDLTYNEYTYILKYPSENFIRFYRVNATWQNALVGMMIRINEPGTTVTIDIGFSYFHSKDIAYLSGENTNTSALTQFVIRNDRRYISDVVLARPTTMTPWSNTITLSDVGSYMIGMGQDALSGYVGIQNMYSRISTNNPNGMQILNNSFDDMQYTANPYPRDYTQYGSTGKTGGGVRLAGARLQ